METWIVPCNIKYYDVFGAFHNLKTLDWKQTNPCIKPGDTVFIFVGAPYNAILFKCLVTKSNLGSVEIDDRKYIIKGEIYESYPRHMELSLIREYPSDLFRYDALTDHGLKGRVMCARRAEESVRHFIESRQKTQ